MRSVKAKKLRRVAVKAAIARDSMFADNFRAIVNELKFFIRLKLCVRIIFKCW